jgi:hypothetical protein
MLMTMAVRVKGLPTMRVTMVQINGANGSQGTLASYPSPSNPPGVGTQLNPSIAWPPLQALAADVDCRAELGKEEGLLVELVAAAQRGMELPELQTAVSRA